MLHLTFCIDANFALQRQIHANALWLVQISNKTEIAPYSLIQESFVLDNVHDRKNDLLCENSTNMKWACSNTRYILSMQTSRLCYTLYTAVSLYNGIDAAFTS